MGGKSKMDNKWDWYPLLEKALEAIVLLIIGYFCSGPFWKWFILTFNKIKFRVWPTMFNVGISIKFKEGKNSETYFNQIKQNLLENVDALGLTRIIKICDWSNTHIFKNREEANRYCVKQGLDLIIWGTFSIDGSKENGKPINDVELKFTYRYPKDKADKSDHLGEAISRDIYSKLAVKNYWKILDNNSASDIKIISKNITDISLYILGLTLKFNWRLFDSIRIFEQLFRKLQTENDSLKDAVIVHLIDCYSILIGESVYKKDYLAAKKYCEKILTYQKNNFSAIAGLARFEYETGNKEKSKQIVANLLSSFPNNPTVIVDAAFISIIQGKYKEAYNHYEKLRSIKTINFDPLDVVEFLGEEYKKRKEPAFLYASSIISYYWTTDRILAKEDLKKFLQTSNELNYKHMRKRARSLLT